MMGFFQPLESEGVAYISTERATEMQRRADVCNGRIESIEEEWEMPF